MIEYALWLGFNASNNATEYEALIISLSITKELEVEQLGAFTDS